MASVAQIVVDKLQALAPQHLRVIDESAGHAGHGASGAHLKVEVVSAAFEGKSLIERHRMVNALLRDELAGRTTRPIHALSIVAKAPAEWAESNKGEV